MPNRHLTAARALLAATLLGALAASPASAAFLAVFSMGNEHYMCTAHTQKRDGTSVESPARLVAGAYGGYFELGTLPATPNGDSPEFDSLALRCWVRDAHTAGTQPYPGEASYSIVLHRDDPFWTPNQTIAPGLGPSLPRDGMTVGMILLADTSANPPPHIDIQRAWIAPFVNLPNNVPIPFGLTAAQYRLTRD
ncbi:hypothetical protein GALL_385490 [mine drainage metagenome]|jgi:hypothetical protein|uniref:Uncharacterized protein n=1 Tax=mine drainage metagenome TaxID=410659 RepID=A0A1J5QID1_9ZZZZ